MHKFELTKLQNDLLVAIGKHPFGKNIYWTGGTLLAYQYLQHRHSVDLDFFSDELFHDDQYLIFINDLKKTINSDKVQMNLQLNRRMFLINRKKEAVKFEIVYFPFSAINKKIFLPEFSIKADSLENIMVNKILSTYQRNEVKDVYDLYCYLNQKPKHNLLQLIKLVEKKFGVEIQPILLLTKINELANNLDSLQPLLFTKKSNLTQEVKKFFQEIFNTTIKLK